MTVTRIEVGDAAPPLTFLTSRGEPWHLEDRRGTVVVLVFHRHIH